MNKSDRTFAKEKKNYALVQKKRFRRRDLLNKVA